MPNSPSPFLAILRAAIVDEAGKATYALIQLFTDWDTRLTNGLNLIGQFIGVINSSAQISGRAGTIGTSLQNLSGGGLLASTAISGTLPHGNIPSAGLGLLGGVVANNPTLHEWVNAIDATGTPQLSQPGFGDIAGSVAAAQLPTPTISTLGGVEANTPVVHEWLNAINTSGIPQLSQPAFTDISGTATAGQVPALSALNGQITAGQLPAAGVTHTVTLAALTTLGTQGSITFTNGQATNIVDPT